MPALATRCRPPEGQLLFRVPEKALGRGECHHLEPKSIMDRRTHHLVPDRQFISIRAVSERWSCSRSTVRRTLRRHGVSPVFLNGAAKNGLLRFDLADVEQIEEVSQRSRRDRPKT
jgi:hypothetical protein